MYGRDRVEQNTSPGWTIGVYHRLLSLNQEVAALAKFPRFEENCFASSEKSTLLGDLYIGKE